MNQDNTEIRKEILASIRRLPRLSSSAGQLLKITSTPEHGIADIINIVKYDAALTANILKIVNSATFAPRMPITAIGRAVALLGGELVVGIALSDAASQLFDSSLAGYGGRRGDLWAHDLLCAIAARKIAALAVPEIEPELAFTAGLLHDLGKAIISDFLRGTFTEIPTEIENGRYPNYLTAEQDLVGMDHSLAGYELARQWKLPEPIPSVLRFHHEPAAAPLEYRAVVYAVHLGDIIATMTGLTTGADGMYYHLDQAYTAYINLSKKKLGQLILSVSEEFNELKTALIKEGEH